jgi:hypothetical protein
VNADVDSLDIVAEDEVHHLEGDSYEAVAVAVIAGDRHEERVRNADRFQLDLSLEGAGLSLALRRLLKVEAYHFPELRKVPVFVGTDKELHFGVVALRVLVADAVY